MSTTKRPGKKFIGAYINQDTKAKLQRIAKSQERTLAYLVEKILSQGVIHLLEKNGSAGAKNIS